MIFGPPETAAPGLWQIHAFGAMVTVIETSSGLVLVDAGLRGSWPLVSAGLRRLGLAEQPVCCAALTHYHPDHCGGLEQIIRATNAPVAVHERDAPYICGEAPPPSPFPSAALTALTRPWLWWFYGKPVAATRRLNDGDFLPGVDEPIQAIHTPGHTPGSVCLWLPERRTLLAGDALQHRFGRLRPPAASVTGDQRQAQASLRKLLNLDVETLCFGHFPPLRKDAQGALARLVEGLALLP